MIYDLFCFSVLSRYRLAACSDNRVGYKFVCATCNTVMFCCRKSKVATTSTESSHCITFGHKHAPECSHFIRKNNENDDALFFGDKKGSSVFPKMCVIWHGSTLVRWILEKVWPMLTASCTYFGFPFQLQSAAEGNKRKQRLWLWCNSSLWCQKGRRWTMCWPLVNSRVLGRDRCRSRVDSENHGK
jgi:hypothetical protein